MYEPQIMSPMVGEIWQEYLTATFEEKQTLNEKIAEADEILDVGLQDAANEYHRKWSELQEAYHKSVTSAFNGYHAVTSAMAHKRMAQLEELVHNGDPSNVTSDN